MAEKLVRLAAKVPGLDPYQRAVLVHLADRAGRVAHQHSTSVPRIAAYTKMCERHVYRMLKALRDMGLISVAGKTAADVNIYVVNLPAPPEGQADSMDGPVILGKPKKQKAVA